MCSNHVNASIAMNCTFVDRNTSRLNDVHAIVVMGLTLANDHFTLFIAHKLAPVPCRRSCQHSNAHKHIGNQLEPPTNEDRVKESSAGGESKGEGRGRKREREKETLMRWIG
jgi:hypothetical protein